jgi:hypothetical protein
LELERRFANQELLFQRLVARDFLVTKIETRDHGGGVVLGSVFAAEKAESKSENLESLSK